MEALRRLALHDIHAASGALFQTTRGWTLPARYGAEPEEYAAARGGAALLDLSDRGVLAVAGPLRQKFLQNILSNDVASCAPGEGCLSALMTTKGHVLAFLRVVVSKDVVDIELPRDRLELVEKTLVHFRVAAPVRFEARHVVILALLGPVAEEILRRTEWEGPRLPEKDEHHVHGALASHPALIARASDLPGEAFVLHVSPESAAPLWTSLCSAGAVPLGRRALDALRIERGEAWYGPDVGEDNLLHETGLLSKYHSSTKGCYVGQEVVARLEARGGHVSRMLRGLRLEAPVSEGAPVLASGRDVGRVTTAAVSPRHGPIALAYIHRACSEPGTVVEVEGVKGSVVGLPFEQTGLR